MRRRTFIELAVAGAAWVLAPYSTSAHTPYRQWVIYRKKHLLILTSKTDGPSYPLGKRVAELLVERLPASKARVTRAPHTKRIASLISTRQMDVAILSRRDATRLMEGRSPFADYGPVKLRTIVALGDYLLVCRDDFPARHAYLVAETLVGGKDELPVAVAIEEGGEVPVHAGARAYSEGRPAPEPPKNDGK